MLKNSLEVLAGRLFSVGRGWAAGRHSHPFIEIIMPTRGRLKVELASGAITAGPGEALFYHPGVEHAECVLPGPAVEFLCYAFTGPASREIPLLTRDLDGRIELLSRWLIEDLESPNEERKKTCRALAGAVLAELARLARYRPREPLDKVRQYLKAHLKQEHTIAELSRLARMSKFHFIRRYKRAMGRTPMDDLRLLRVEAACRLLLTTDLPLKTISAQAGFCDEYYFSRVFKDYYRLSPGVFRHKRPLKKAESRASIPADDSAAAALFRQAAKL